MKNKQNEKAIFKFFSVHEGADIILTRNLAMKRFRLSEDEFNYWLGKWRSARSKDGAAGLVGRFEPSAV